MKALIIISLLFVFNNLYAQDASSYFPAQTGFKWNYRVVPLDSANNQIDTLTYYRIDSFAVVQNYKGKTANFIVSKAGLPESIQYVPFYDTAYISLEGSDASLYYRLFNIDSLINSSKMIGDKRHLAKISKVNNIEGWLSFYRFASAENTSYQVFSIDTTIVYDSTSLPVRFQINAMRTTDQSINLDGAPFECKKFVVNNNVSYLLGGSIPVPILTISDTTWIAAGEWIVQDIMPSVNLDLSAFGVGKIFIPGLKQSLILQLPTGIDNSIAEVKQFKLFQNYPNPFNPSTIIKYSLSGNSNVDLTVYDLLGNRVTTLINKVQNAGDYEVTFNPSLINGGLSTGVYFYTLKTGSGIISKKLIYLK